AYSGRTMPTLIRLFIALLVLAGIAVGGMLLLAVFVDPGEKEVRVRIPATQLGAGMPADDPLGLRQPPPPLPGTQTTTAAPAAENGPVDEDGVRTVDIPE